MSTDAIARRIEEWNGQSVVISHDKATGTWIFIALHDLSLGPAVGGSRMKSYPVLEDAILDATRLAEGMTYKWAAVDLPFGGGKSVLAVPHAMEGEERVGLLRRYGRILASLGGRFSTGVDLGTDPEDMKIVAEVAPRCVKGVVEGVSRDPGPYTALGVHSGIRAALLHRFGDASPAGRSFLLQGVGDVGLPLARLLAEAGGRLLVTDLNEDLASTVAAETDGETVPGDRVYETECDVFVPCAIGAILSPRTIPRLRCAIVAGSANNQLETLEDADRLHEQGILYAPDYIVNAGGAIAFGRMSLGEQDDGEIRAEVRRIEATLNRIFEEADRALESPVHAALRLAERVLARARETAA